MTVQNEYPSDLDRSFFALPLKLLKHITKPIISPSLGTRYNFYLPRQHLGAISSPPGRKGARTDCARHTHQATQLTYTNVGTSETQRLPPLGPSRCQQSVCSTEHRTSMARDFPTAAPPAPPMHDHYRHIRAAAEPVFALLLLEEPELPQNFSNRQNGVYSWLSGSLLLRARPDKLYR